jgi:CRP/FNR family transcriptional regulator, polysaccharide utilization system transcription regulator
MRFTRSCHCNSCALKCDIHPALVKNGMSVEELSPLYALLKKNDIICRQGTEVTHALFLVSGSAKLYIEGLNNRNIILNILKPPAYIGLLLFFENPHYFCSLSALKQSEVCVIDVELVKKLYVANYELLLGLNKAF